MLRLLSFAAAAAAAAAQVDITINTNVVTNPNVNKKSMGCHHDYGFAQAPRGFYANMVYGSAFEAGTCSVPAWTSYGSDGWNALATESSFATQPSMGLGLNNGAKTEYGVMNKGLCGAGMVLEANQPYNVELFVWTGGNAAMFVQLMDTTTNTVLARQDFTATSTGPSWGSTWIKYNLTLTPNASTSCSSIPFGSDPTIDCGKDAGPAHICVKCGGALVIGISQPGAGVNVGYTAMLPGPWNLLVDPRSGRPLPVLKSGADLLTTMGVTMMRSGGSVSQSMRWKDWRGPQWNRASDSMMWGSSLLAGWGPFEVIDMCNALDIEPIVTLAYDANDAGDFADLVEYCWGSNATSWGMRRYMDGHPEVFNITVFELGNEQYNPNYLEQVAAMEARAAAVGAPPLHYMFPQNSGLNASDAQQAMAMGLPIARLMPDLHVGAGGAVEEAAALFSNPPVSGFNQSAINCETNANTHDMTRALNEASDLIDWFTFDVSVTDRIYGRAASFCTGTSNAFDSWDQGISFFLPNMTWLQPPGYVHQMISNTWAETTLQTLINGGSKPTFAAQRTADGSKLVLRVVANGQPESLAITLAGGAAAAGPSYTLWTLTGQPNADNTPSNPTAISPVQQQVPITAGATSIAATVPANTFAIMVVQLQ